MQTEQILESEGIKLRQLWQIIGGESEVAILNSLNVIGCNDFGSIGIELSSKWALYFII
ncbi:MAG: hypothetical protein VW394_05805 [Candidatus Heimdallarchaeota archaeon]